MQMGVWGQNSAHESPSLQVVEEFLHPVRKRCSFVGLSLWLSRAYLGNCSEFQV